MSKVFKVTPVYGTHIDIEIDIHLYIGEYRLIDIHLYIGEYRLIDTHLYIGEYSIVTVLETTTEILQTWYAIKHNDNNTMKRENQLKHHLPV